METSQKVLLFGIVVFAACAIASFSGCASAQNCTTTGIPLIYTTTTCTQQPTLDQP